MANKKISGYTEKTALDTTDLFLIEQAAGSYRKFSSSRLTRVITSSVTLTIGTGGTYATYKAAMDYLRDKWINRGAVVTLQQKSDLVVSTSTDYNFTDYNCALYMNHPCSRRIKIDLNGYDITVGVGDTTAIHGMVCGHSSYLNIYSSQAGSVIKTNNNGYGYGIVADSHGYVTNLTSSSYPVTIGASGYGFRVGVYAAGNSVMYLGYTNIYYSALYGVYSTDAGMINAATVDIANNTNGGFQARYSSLIMRLGATGAQSESVSPELNTDGNYNSFIH